MAQHLILVDTSVLIDYFRKKDKHRSLLVALVRAGYQLRISAVTEFELLTRPIYVTGSGGIIDALFLEP